jgi:hypothetical protein
MDYFSFNSCCTNISRVNAGGLIFKRKSTKINWRPSQLEKQLYTDITINQTEKLKHRHTSGYLVFQNPLFKLEGLMLCGNEKNIYAGVSVCQNYFENKNLIKFEEPVKMFSKTCKTDPVEKKEFIISTELGFCNYIFKGKLSNQVHRLVVYGYNDDLLI